MTRIERYKDEIRKIEAKQRECVRRCDLLGLQKLNEDLAEAKQKLADAEEYAAKPLTEFLSREEIQKSNIIPILLECHMAADFLNDCAFLLSKSIEKLGLQPVSILPDLKEILKKSNMFASILCTKGEDLSAILTDNDTLIAALHKKTLSYVEQRMKCI